MNSSGLPKHLIEGNYPSPVLMPTREDTWIIRPDDTTRIIGSS